MIEGGLRKNGILKGSNGRNRFVSIITVVFNAVDGLEETMLSVKNLLNDNIEYIIIDGRSTDGTVELIRKHEGMINYWISEEDKGIYDAMNKGWKKASTNSHILFLGAGDKLLNLPDDLELDDDTIYYGNVDLGGKSLFISKVDFRLKIGNTLHHQALLIPKSLSPGPPFNASFKVYADFDFNQRLYKQNAKFHKLNNFLSYASPDGFSQQYSTYEWIKIVQKNFGTLYASIAIIYYFFQKIKTKKS